MIRAVRTIKLLLRRSELAIVSSRGSARKADDSETIRGLWSRRTGAGEESTQTEVSQQTGQRQTVGRVVRGRKDDHLCCRYTQYHMSILSIQENGRPYLFSGLPVSCLNDTSHRLCSITQQHECESDRAPVKQSPRLVSISARSPYATHRRSLRVSLVGFED